MWDDLFLPLSSRCKRRYPTCFRTPPCDELEDQQEGTAYYLVVAHKVIYLMFKKIFIYISAEALWKENQGLDMHLEHDVYLL